MSSASPPYIIPFFITHQGCPHRCVFCNQKKITGVKEHSVTGDLVKAVIEERLKLPRHSSRGKVVVAFYGGSFTGLSDRQQLELLDTVQPFIERGEVAGIRLSTRPDRIDQEIVDFLKDKGVQTVELGVQSMDDRVLDISERGHSAADSENAIRDIREAGIEVGVQLMVGLPGQTTKSCLDSAKKVANLAPDLVRIYPAVVLRESELADRYMAGSYHPLSLARAVVLSGRICEVFDLHNVKVVRIGLQATDTIEDEILAGPYHPAFGELVRSRNLHRKVLKVLKDPLRPSLAQLLVADEDQSVFRGNGNSCRERLLKNGLLADVEVVFEKGRARGTIEVVAGSAGGGQVTRMCCREVRRGGRG